MLPILSVKYFKMEYNFGGALRYGYITSITNKGIIAENVYQNLFPPSKFLIKISSFMVIKSKVLLKKKVLNKLNYKTPKFS